MTEIYSQKKIELQATNRNYSRPWSLLSDEYVTYRHDVPTPDRVLFTLIRAMKARQFAESYRGFAVGASAEAQRDTGTHLLTRQGANYKNGPGNSSVDTHAEQLILDSLESCEEIMILAVVGEQQSDHASNKSSITLHPCGKCRNALQAAPQVTDKTLVVCGTPDGRSIEWGSVDDFVAFHDGAADRLGRAVFDSMPEVLVPVPLDKPLDLATMEIDTSEWDASVTYPLTEWIYSRA